MKKTISFALLAVLLTPFVAGASAGYHYNPWGGYQYPQYYYPQQTYQYPSYGMYGSNVNVNVNTNTMGYWQQPYYQEYWQQPVYYGYGGYGYDTYNWGGYGYYQGQMSYPYSWYAPSYTYGW